jgi:hypothetical protein
VGIMKAEELIKILQEHPDWKVLCADDDYEERPINKVEKVKDTDYRKKIDTYYFLLD